MSEIDWSASSPLALSYRTLMLIIVGLVALSLFPGDAIVPCLPTMSHALNTSTHAIQLSISVFLLASGLSQVTWGIVNERIGTRTGLLWSLSLFLIGCLLSAISTQLSYLLIGGFYKDWGLPIA